MYGEIEVEFAKYSCKLLEGVGDALEVYGRCIMSASAGGTNTDDGGNSMKKKIAQLTGSEQQQQRYSVSDLPTAYKRVMVYRDRVISVNHQVLHCLIKDGGKGDCVINKIKQMVAAVVTFTEERWLMSANGT